MSATNLDDVVKGIASTGLSSLKTNLGKAWDSLTDQERKDCERLLATLGKARLEELAGKDVSSYLPVLEAAFLQWKAVGSMELAQAFKATAQEVLGYVGAIAGSLLATFVKGVL